MNDPSKRPEPNAHQDLPRAFTEPVEENERHLTELEEKARIGTLTPKEQKLLELRTGFRFLLRQACSLTSNALRVRFMPCIESAQSAIADLESEE